MSSAQPVFFEAFRGIKRVDRKAGIIYGVAFGTVGEVRGHDEHFDRRTLELYEQLCKQFTGGVRIKADHGSGVFATVGSYRDARIEGNKLVGDLHLLPNAEARDLLLDMAEEMADTFGISPHILRTLETVNGRKYTRPTEIFHADIVDIPATNPAGLYSAKVGVDSRGEDMSDQPTPAAFSALQTQVTEFSTKFAALVENSTKYAAQIGELTTKLAASEAKFSALEKDRDALRADVTKLQGEKEGRDQIVAETTEKTVVKFAAKLGVSGAPGAGSDNDKTKDSGGKQEPKTFAALVAEQLAKDPKAGKSAAVEFCVKQFPKEHAEYAKVGGPL